MINKKKILFITHYSDLYGANLSLLQVITGLRNKCEIEPLVIIPKEGDMTKKLIENNIPYIISFFNWSKTKKVAPFKYRMKLFLQNIYYFLVLYYKVHNKNIDIIYTNSSVTNMGAYLKFFIHKPHIWHLRELGFESYGVEHLLGKKFQSIVYNYSGDKFIAISKFIKQYYSIYISVDKIHLVYNGLPTVSNEFISSHKSSLNEIVIIGSINPEKKQMELIQASNILKNIYGINNFRINIIGNGDSYYIKDIKNYCHKHNLSSNILWHGYKYNVSEILRNMDIGVMCSTYEAFGRVTIEYSLHGLAVIASNSGANTELIKNGETGFTYNDINELAKELKYLINNRDLLLELSKNGKEYVSKKFSEDILIKSLAQILQK